MAIQDHRLIDIGLHIEKRTATHEQAQRANSRRCRCGQCAICLDNARRERIFRRNLPIHNITRIDRFGSCLAARLSHLGVDHPAEHPDRGRHCQRYGCHALIFGDRGKILHCRAKLNAHG